jgi:hypothetical protein
LLLDIREQSDELIKELRRLDAVIALLLPGSSATTIGEFPECVAVGNSDQGFFGSGVLLDQQWLLTSSDCRAATKMFAGISVSADHDLYDITLKQENELLAIFEVADYEVKVTAPILPKDDCPLVSGTPLRVVAFGNSDPDGGSFGQQREARFVVDQAGDVRIYATSESGLCAGDSGGPAFYDDGRDHNDQTPRLLLGISDSTVGDDCESGGIFATLVGQKAWIEDVIKPLIFEEGCPPLMVEIGSINQSSSAGIAERDGADDRAFGGRARTRMRRSEPAPTRKRSQAKKSGSPRRH